MKGNSKIVEEIPLSSRTAAKESYVKQKTRAKFQQLIKASQLHASSSHMQKECDKEKKLQDRERKRSSHYSPTDADQVEETPLLIKGELHPSIEQSGERIGSSNLGFVTEEKYPSSVPIDTNKSLSPPTHEKSSLPTEYIWVEGNTELGNSQKNYPGPKEKSKHKKSNVKLNDQNVPFNERTSTPKPVPRTKYKLHKHTLGEKSESLHELKAFNEPQSPISITEHSDLNGVNNTFGDKSEFKSDTLINGKNAKILHTTEEFSTYGSNKLSENNAVLKISHEVMSLQKNGKKQSKKCGKKHLMEIKAKEESSQEEKNNSGVSTSYTTPKMFSKEETAINHQGFEGNILGIIIHYCDRLKTEFLVSHPLVRVHIIDEENGTYVKKLNKDRPVTSFYETQHDSVDYIMPVMTQPFTFSQKRLQHPAWEEKLIFNENFNYFINKKPKVILFFEVLDFLNPSRVGQQYHKFHNQKGWQRLAWAFLKLVGGNNVLNVGRKLRLQLYKPPTQNINAKSSEIEIYYWWSKLPKQAFQGSLYVTVEPVAFHEVEPALRSMLPMQQEKGKTTLEELAKTLENGTTASPKSSVNESIPGKSDGDERYQWSRLPEQPCEVPNIQLLSLYTVAQKCFCVKFSYDGRSLAAGCGITDQHWLHIYEIPSGNLLMKQAAHSGIIYDLDWFSNDNWLLSASGDCTVGLWNMTGSFSKVSILSHPSFVYSAKFQPSYPNIVGTGSYDHIVRIWIVTSNGFGQLLREFEGHHSHVNTICWNENGTRLFSADNIGEVKVWKTAWFGKFPDTEMCKKWSLENEICHNDIQGIPINKISLDQLENRLLLQCRDSTSVLLDLERKVIIQKYRGTVNLQNLLRGCVSPCGNLLFSGGEDGNVYVWEFHTGTQIAIYSKLLTGPISCIDYHPHDHMITFCSLEENIPILVYKYEEMAPSLLNCKRNEQETVSLPKKLEESVPYDMHPVSPDINIERMKVPLKQTDHHRIGNRTVSSLSVPNTSRLTVETKLPEKSKVFQMNREQSILQNVHDSTYLSWGSTFDENSLQYVAVYDFEPQNADELRLRQGDKLSVIRYETDDWWLGVLQNEKQGYFPSNYVIIDPDSETSYGACGGIDDVLEDTPKALTAVITKSGKFEIISGPEENEELLHQSPRKKKTTKKVKSKSYDFDQPQQDLLQRSRRNRRKHSQNNTKE